MLSQGIPIDEKMRKRLSPVAENGDTILYEYRPTLFRPLLVNYLPLTFTRRCRYMYEYLHRGGYRVYYLSQNDTAVGFCVVTPGGRQLKQSSKEDIVLGPYYVAAQERGKGYSKTLIRMVLDHYPKGYHGAFDWILRSNEASIRTTVGCGFQPIASLNVVGLMRRPVVAEDGQYILYWYDRQR